MLISAPSFDHQSDDFLSLPQIASFGLCLQYSITYMKKRSESEDLRPKRVSYHDHHSLEEETDLR